MLKVNFNGNPNIGLLGIATDSYCIIGSRLSEKLMDEIRRVLKVPVIHTTICGTELAGVFCAANSNCLLLPDIVFDNELKTLERHNIKYEAIDTNNTALGNNILCNDKGCLVSKDFQKKEIGKIEKALGVKAVKARIDGLDIVGALAALNKKGCLAHEDIKEEEIKIIEDILGIKCGTGTVNFGSPFIKSGIIANSNGFIISRSSSGHEIINADDGLGFLDR